MNPPSSSSPPVGGFACGTRKSLGDNGQYLLFEAAPFWRGRDGRRLRSRGAFRAAARHAGALRDFVLGVKMVDGRGQALAFGGQVMKNVAG